MNQEIEQCKHKESKRQNTIRVRAETVKPSSWSKDWENLNISKSDFKTKSTQIKDEKEYEYNFRD